VGEGDRVGTEIDPEGLAAPERWILSRLSRTVAEVDEHLEAFRFDLACHGLYHFFWGDLCDWYIELSKPALFGEAPRPRAGEVLLTVLDQSLRALHPVMPHLTEELWQRLPGHEAVHPETIVLAPYPKPVAAWEDDDAERSMEVLIEVVTRVRNLRAELGVPAAERMKVWLSADDPDLAAFLGEQAPLAAFLCRADVTAEAGGGDSAPEGAARDLVSGVRVALVPPERELGEEERRRLERELAKLEGEITAAEKRLSNEAFLAKAPADVVAGNRARLADLNERRRGLLAGLGRP
jgi:valyl-tRNA synthetase